MIRVIKAGCHQVSQNSFVDGYNTKDFDLPELEAHIKNKKTGEFLGIEIIENELTTAEEK